MINAISVLFSGGPDSTLAVLKALEEAEQVHLLTYHHKIMGKIGKHKKVADELIEKFGSERVILHEEDIHQSFIKNYFYQLKNKIFRYRTYYVPWVCGACKLSMHNRTIEYNKKFNIKITYDGANRESSPLFPAQMDTYIDVMKKFYESNGMSYDCPIYDVEGTDKETEKYGLTSTKNTKEEHVVFSTQHVCLVGLAVHAHGRLYYKPFRGKERTRKLSGKFLTEILESKFYNKKQEC